LRYHMSDDGYSRAYRDDRYARGGSAFGASAPGQQDDPLTELARLIGQGDALAQQQQVSWQQASVQQGSMSADPANYPDPSNYDGYHYPASGAQLPDPNYDPQHYGQGYADPQFQGHPYQQQHDGFHGGYPQQQQGHQMAPFYGNDGHGGRDHGGHDHHDDRLDDDYDDPPSSGRGGFLTVVAIFCLAVIGTAGAFAYRTFFTPSAASQPPVVMADTKPTKIVPANPNDGANQPSADAGQVERMVPREEPPVNLQGLTSGPPRVVTAPPASPALQMGMSSPPGEPKRVRVVTFPQPGDPFGPQIASNSPTLPAPSAPISQNSGSAPAPSAPPPRWNAAAPKVQAAPAPPSDPPGDVPLSLSPQAVTPQAPAPHVMKLTSAPSKTAVAGGSYVVQLSAQRSEDDAQSTFRALQAKYPSLLEGRQPIIRKKDLASGVFYGVQVGPLAHDEAVQLCENLKSAHGECWVQAN
jgi:hypothetical protein